MRERERGHFFDYSRPTDNWLTAAGERISYVCKVP
jgi:hypothetical protein